jgi:aldehyde dehydrogenase
MIYAKPNTQGAVVDFKQRYDNFIGGEWVPPVNGNYFDNVSPVNGKPFCAVARSDEADINLALDAAHAARDAWGRTSVTARSNILLKIADRIEQNLEMLAVAETWDNGKAVRETLNADIPLCVDHFRYFAGCIRAQEGSIGEIDEHTVAYHFHEPLGVVGQIIPWNFPILMAAWKLAPALAAGNCVVLKPAEQTPASILVLMELIADLLPAGVLNIVNGFGLEAGKALATSTRIAKIAFTGSTPVGAQIMKYAADNIIPSTVELGGKSPNVYFADVLDQETPSSASASRARCWPSSTRARSAPARRACWCRSPCTSASSIWSSSARARSSAATRSIPTSWSAPRPRRSSTRRSWATSRSAATRARRC